MKRFSAALTVEHIGEPLGIGTPAPRLSWTVTAPDGWRPTAHEIRADDRTTGRVDSTDSVLVAWPFPPLRSREQRTVQVRVWGVGDREPSDWSDQVVVEVGLLDPADWTAVAISPATRPPAGRDGPGVLLRRPFTVRGPVAAARLYLTAHGVTEAEIDGERVGDETLAPGWTSYDHRLRYRTHDVTHLLRDGENVLGAHLADGWFRGRLGWHGGNRDLWGDRVALLAQLEIRYADGRTATVGTDPAWRCAPGPIVATGLYDGECHDARAEQPGWSSPDFDDTGWTGVQVVPRDPGTLVAPAGPPVRCTEERAPVALTRHASGATVVDFGQNVVGRVAVRVQGPAGTRVRIRHAEVLECGELCTRPLRDAAATDVYVVRGDGPEQWEPRFTLHGFRYAEISGCEVTTGDVVARVHHSDLRRTGWFSCSDERVTRLHENVVWSMRGNFLDVPTDCPQRDERLGWTGDIQVFAPTAAFLYDCAGLLSSWLRDVAAEQRLDGAVPWYVPDLPGATLDTTQPIAVWGDVAVLTPWTLYERFGDVGVLEAQFDSARAWVDGVAARCGPDGRWDTGMQLGDWLDPAAPPDDPAAARTDPHLVATAYHARAAERLSRIAGILGHTADERRYRALAERVAVAFAAAYVDADGRVAGDTPTGYALAIVFDLIPDATRRARAGARLVELVAEAGHRIATGFAGTPLVCDALSAVGADASAYALLTEPGCPSWLYAVDQGATTIWERWDSLLPDGTVNPGEMTSFNHYALGAVADWMHRVVGGLAPAAPGYRRLLVRPRPGGGLTWARTRHDTPYGPAEVDWEIIGDELLVRLTVPPGATATVDLPGAAPVEVGSGRHEFRSAHPPESANLTRSSRASTTGEG